MKSLRFCRTLPLAFLRFQQLKKIRYNMQRWAHRYFRSLIANYHSLISVVIYQFTYSSDLPKANWKIPIFRKDFDSYQFKEKLSDLTKQLPIKFKYRPSKYIKNAQFNLILNKYIKKLNLKISWKNFWKYFKMPNFLQFWKNYYKEHIILLNAFVHWMLNDKMINLWNLINNIKPTFFVLSELSIYRLLILEITKIAIYWCWTMEKKYELAVSILGKSTYRVPSSANV